MSSDHQQEILRLREQHLSPKQIARQLGLRPSEVSAILQAQAEQVTQARSARGKLPPLKHCLIDESAAHALLDPHPSEDADASADPFGHGLAQIFVTRSERNMLWVGSYLVDYWCLGVKDCFGPTKMDQHKYDQLIQGSFARSEQAIREISLAQAQSIIWGAVDYAAELGFSPHRDFEAAKAHAGQLEQPLQPLSFGRDGKPFFISGPYDQPRRILATLRDRVGEGNFDYLIQA
jgi:hypothetical protein